MRHNTLRIYYWWEGNGGFIWKVSAQGYLKY